MSIVEEIKASSMLDDGIEAIVDDLNKKAPSIPVSLLHLCNTYNTDVAAFHSRVPTVLKPAPLPVFDDILAFSQWEQPLETTRPAGWYPLDIVAMPTNTYHYRPKAPAEPNMVQDPEVYAFYKANADQWVDRPPLKRSNYEHPLILAPSIYMGATDDEIKKLVERARETQKHLDSKYDSALQFHCRMQSSAYHVAATEAWKTYKKEKEVFDIQQKEQQNYDSYLNDIRQYPAAFREYTLHQEIIDLWQVKDYCEKDAAKLRQLYVQYQTILEQNKKDWSYYNDEQSRYGAKWWLELDVLTHGASLGPKAKRFSISSVVPGWSEYKSECSDHSGSYNQCRHSVGYCTSKLTRFTVTEKHFRHTLHVTNLRFTVASPFQIKMSFRYSGLDSTLEHPCYITLQQVDAVNLDRIAA